MKLHEWQKKEQETLRLSPCCVCGKPITDGYYGRWGNGGACSKTCDAIEEAKPKYERKDHELAVVPEACSNES